VECTSALVFCSSQLTTSVRASRAATLCPPTPTPARSAGLDQHHSSGLRNRCPHPVVHSHARASPDAPERVLELVLPRWRLARHNLLQLVDPPAPRPRHQGLCPPSVCVQPSPILCAAPAVQHDRSLALPVPRQRPRCRMAHTAAAKASESRTYDGTHGWTVAHLRACAHAAAACRACADTQGGSASLCEHTLDRVGAAAVDSEA
jgi:hypothetical protein